MSIIWDVDVERPVLPPLRGTVAADLCVIGLGGSGLTAVREAQARGMSVVGIDADRIAAGAAGRNGGFLLAGIAAFHHDAIDAHGHDKALALYQHTVEEMDKFEAAAPQAVRREGVLRKAHDDAEWEDCLVHRDALRADGFDADVHESWQGRGILIPTDGTFHPAMRACLLANAAIADGARLYADTPAIEIEPGVVHTPEGEVRAANILVAVDGNLHRAVPSLAERVRPVRLQMVATAPTDVRLTHAVYARDGWDYWQQLEDGRVAIGGGRDVLGDGEWTDATEPTDAARAYLISLLAEMGIDAPIEHHWAATVSYTDNGLPIVEEIQPGVWAIGGYCGTGNIVGAALGRGVVEQFATGQSRVVSDFTAD